MLIEKDPGLALARTHRAMRAHLTRKLTAEGFTFEQFQTLLGLKQGDGIPQYVLADRLYLEPTYTARMLRRVEKAGLISRPRDKADTRVRRVRLTPEGRAAWESLQRIQEQHLVDVFSCLDEARIGELIGLLNLIYECITEVMHSEP